jgi:long-chain acyl-CoA synthetase
LFENNEELIAIPEVIEQIRHEVDIINQTLSTHEQINRIRLVGDEWSPSTGELSPTLKLRRAVIAAKYQKLIDEIYSMKKN